MCGPGGETDNSETSCLVTIGKLQPTSIPQSSDLMDSPPVTEFISRHSLDGKFTFVDQRYSIIALMLPPVVCGSLWKFLA